MTPQEKTILNHLQKHGGISQAEASLVYRIRSLPRRIADLKEAGYDIKSELKKDATGQRYARYTLVTTVTPLLTIKYSRSGNVVLNFIRNFMGVPTNNAV